MKNHEQVRAANALAALEKYGGFEGQNKGDPVTGMPAIVVNNGLLAALAFCQDKGGDYNKLVSAIQEHLASDGIGGLIGKDVKIVDSLVKGDSEHLRLCTNETLLYLNYLRRFAKAQKK